MLQSSGNLLKTKWHDPSQRKRVKMDEHGRFGCVSAHWEQWFENQLEPFMMRTLNPQLFSDYSGFCFDLLAQFSVIFWLPGLFVRDLSAQAGVASIRTVALNKINERLVQRKPHGLHDVAHANDGPHAHDGSNDGLWQRLGLGQLGRMLSNASNIIYLHLQKDAQTDS